MSTQSSNPQPSPMPIAALRRSKLLYRYGITEIVISVLLFSSCVWSTAADNTIYSSYFGFACSMFYIVLGLLTALTSNDINYRHRDVAVCFVMNIIGSSVFCVLAITTAVVEWSGYEVWCWTFRVDNPFIKSLINRPRCQESPMTLFFPIIFLTLTMSLISTVLSVVTWRILGYCNKSSINYCCTPSNLLTVFPPYVSNHQSTYEPQETNQLPVPAYQPQLRVNDTPPAYTEHVIPGHKTVRNNYPLPVKK